MVVPTPSQLNRELIEFEGEVRHTIRGGPEAPQEPCLPLQSEAVERQDRPGLVEEIHQDHGR